MRLAIIGTGYVGLVAGAGFADFGNDVCCVDVNVERITRLQRGSIPIHEPGLKELIARNLEAGRLRFTTDTASAVRGADVVFLAVGTPQRDGEGAPDLSDIEATARAVGRAVDQFTVIVNKSTVPVGTGDRVREIIEDETAQRFAVASNPEFLKEGDAVADFMRPMRIVIGTDDPAAVEVLRRLYAPFVRTGDRIVLMDLRQEKGDRFIFFLQSEILTLWSVLRRDKPCPGRPGSLYPVLLITWFNAVITDKSCLPRTRIFSSTSRISRS